jgi:peptidylprolyl isomerase
MEGNERNDVSLVTRTVRFLVRLRVVVALVAVSSAACASAPAPAPATPAGPPAPAPVDLDQKVAWMLRLEHQRILRDADVPSLPAPAPGAPRAYAPAAAAHLGALSRDPDPGLRRRAVLSLGRTRLVDALPWIVDALADADAEVRAMAAFGVGLVGVVAGVGPLEAALKDPDPMVRGRAAEGLGLIGRVAATAAPAVAESAAACPAALAAIQPDEETAPDPVVDACRLSLFALVRLRNYDALARVALDPQGAPVSRWWPVAYALQRIGDRRAAEALVVLSGTPGIYTRAFAIRGLASLDDPRVAAIAAPIAADTAADVRLRIVSVRALAAAGGTAAVAPVMALAFGAETPPNLALEAVAALGSLRAIDAVGDLTDLLTHSSPGMRLAAMTAIARIDPEQFLLLLSSLPADRDPGVRAGLLSLLATLPAESVRPAIEAMARDDTDTRVVPDALRALAAVESPELLPKLTAAFSSPDVGIRAAAASIAGERRPTGAATRLAGAYEKGLSDASPDARQAAIEGLAAIGGAEAMAVVTRALADPSWPVRLRAADLLSRGGAAAAAPARPAPTREPLEVFASDAVLHPQYSPRAFIETRHGVIEISLNVVVSPMTTRSFVELVRSGFYNGLRVHRLIPHFVIQTGDPRGDGTGGPGYTVADEVSPQPFIRGTVGMARGGRDDAGSQFFITLSPQPHLDGEYTAFGQVVAGWDVLDKVTPNEVIERIRIWDGVSWR